MRAFFIDVDAGEIPQMIERQEHRSSVRLVPAGASGRAFLSNPLQRVWDNGLHVRIRVVLELDQRGDGGLGGGPDLAQHFRGGPSHAWLGVAQQLDQLGNGRVGRRSKPAQECGDEESH